MTRFDYPFTIDFVWVQRSIIEVYWDSGRYSMFDRIWIPIPVMRIVLNDSWFKNPESIYPEAQDNEWDPIPF